MRCTSLLHHGSSCSTFSTLVGTSATCGLSSTFPNGLCSRYTIGDDVFTYSAGMAKFSVIPLAAINPCSHPPRKLTNWLKGKLERLVSGGAGPRRVEARPTDRQDMHSPIFHLDLHRVLAEGLVDIQLFPKPRVNRQRDGN